ncbi:hypothetical protein SAMN05421819_2304 [Bryocella elongata]|uniref:Uncharacterized protein n=1 Tax=Bryocella elongata TaxID=863522 RepID=A0A1H5YHP1_9BACT|nr:hypothetical protein SAMN05421819_2304 [Bryocella elongata]
MQDESSGIPRGVTGSLSGSRVLPEPVERRFAHDYASAMALIRSS